MINIVKKKKKERLERIEKARRLVKAWELSRECKKFLRENTTAWIDPDHEMEKKRQEEKRQEQRERAEAAKERFLEGQGRKRRMRMIREMLSKIPKAEAERIKCELRSEENKEFAEIKKNIWRK